MPEDKHSSIQLRRERAEINERIQTIASAEEVTEEMETEFDELNTRFDGLTKRIDIAEKAEARAHIAAKPSAEIPGSNLDQGDDADEVLEIEGIENTLYQQPKEKVEKGAHLARVIQVLGVCGNNFRAAAELYVERYRDDDISMALSAGSAAAGGVLIPARRTRDVIELLRPRTVVRGLGARTVPLPNGNLTMPKLTAGGTATYIGTDDDVPETGESFGDLSLTARKLAALVPVSNDLIAYVDQDVQQVIIDDLVQVIAIREDKAFIRDDGTQDTPKGMRHWAVSGNVIAANGTINLANTGTDTSKLRLALSSANVRFIRPGWIMSPRTREYLAELRDGNGNKAYPEIEQGRFKGYPYRETTQVPENLGAGSDESELYLCDFFDAVIGEVRDLRLSVSTEASYKSGGSLVSAFSKDQTVIRVIAEHDFGMRHNESVAVLTGVKWGA